MDYLFSQPNPKITWTYYALKGRASLWVAPNSLSNICIPEVGHMHGARLDQGRIEWLSSTLRRPDVLNDVADCVLSSDVSWITPAGQYSDHPINSGQGPSWIAAIVNAIGNNTTCDDGIWLLERHGHIHHLGRLGRLVRSRAAGIPERRESETTINLAFRVPLVVVSAYSTKPGYISNQEYDFGSILKGIEGIFGLGNLGFADARATNDLHDFFNFRQAPAVYKTIQAPLEGSFFTKNATTEVAPPDTD
jgi:hypothetical protein